MLYWYKSGNTDAKGQFLTATAQRLLLKLDKWARCVVGGGVGVAEGGVHALGGGGA